MNDYILNQWQLFRSVKFDELTDIRLQLHHAAQLAAAPGRYLLPTRRDDSNTNFIWSSQYQAMLGEPVGEEFPLQGALRPADLTIQLIDEDDIIMEALPLNGKSLEEAFGWIKKQLSGKKVDTTSLSLKMPYELPDHPVRSGEPFQFHSPQLFEELAKYWSNAHLLLCDIIHRTPDASPVRCWPHHFDISTLITVEEHPDPPPLLLCNPLALPEYKVRLTAGFSCRRQVAHQGLGWRDFNGGEDRYPTLCGSTNYPD
jgi:hypothetical protein